MSYNISKLAIIDLRPNIYKIGIWKELAKQKKIESHTYFLNDDGVFSSYYDKDSGVQRKSDVWLLEKFSFSFPKDLSPFKNKRSLRFINPEVIINLLKRRHTAILVHGYDNPTYLISIVVSKILGIKIIFRGEAVLRNTKDNHIFRSWLKKFYVTNILKLCDSIMYSCSGNKEYYKYYGVDDNKLIPISCAVDNSFYRSKAKGINSNDIRKELKISEDKFVVLFLARFTKRKRGEDLIRAVSNINHEKITLLFVGDGPEVKLLEELCIRANIDSRFVGFKEQVEIPMYYSVSNLAVIISEYDPSPKVMNEAMNFKLPVIVTEAVGTAPDLVKENINGYIISTGDVAQLSDKIDYLNLNRDIARKMGEESYKIVENFNFSDNVRNIIKALHY